jgi:hypothetical protein
MGTPGMSSQSMHSTRDERRLVEVREKLQVLRISSRDDFNLPARYSALVKLETIIQGRVTQERTATRSRRPDTR